MNILFYIPEDWNVCTHRLPLIEGAVREGHTVTVVTRVKDHKEIIEAAGAKVLNAKLRRGFRDPVSDFRGLLDLIRIYRQVDPDLVHQVTPKTCLWGSMAAWRTGVPGVINALAGLGYLYVATGWKVRLLRPFITLAFRVLLGRGRSRVIVQNVDDQAFFSDVIGIDPELVILIQGSGVNTTLYQPVEPPPADRIRVCLVARMIWEKGIRETIAAARIIREMRDDIEIILVGSTDSETPAGIPEKDLRAWTAEGLVTWRGHEDDVPSLLNSCHIALLPTYREGFPKSLLEAAACGLPIIATDVTGCREICRDGVNGLMIKSHDAESIVDAVIKLADDPDLRAKFGRESRRIVTENFAEEIVVEQTMELYRTMGRELEIGSEIGEGR